MRIGTLRRSAVAVRRGERVDQDAIVLDELESPPFSQDGGALLDRLTHRCEIIETANDSYRFKKRS